MGLDVPEGERTAVARGEVEEANLEAGSGEGGEGEGTAGEGEEIVAGAGGVEDEKEVVHRGLRGGAVNERPPPVGAGAPREKENQGTGWVTRTRGTWPGFGPGGA